nr:PAP 25A-associated domain containing protein [Haemonchus contortus]
MAETDDSSEERSMLARYRSYEHAYSIEPNIKAIESAQKRFSQLLSGHFAYGEDLRNLSQEIQEHYLANRQTTEDYENKMSAMYELGHIIRKHRRWKFKLFPSGSTMTGLASKGSDLDLTVWIPHARKYYANESEAAFDILRNIRHFLFTDKEINYKLESVLYVEAKVPVLKIKWKKGLETDLSCSTEMFVSGIQNSYLIRGFALWDKRFAPLCMLVKDWASRNDVKNPKHGGFNSYAMVLLVVHFLQCAVFPPVLPNLQELFPRKYARNCDGEIRFPREIDFGDRSFPDDCPEMEKCGMSLAELFIRFLDYYSRFDFGHHYICMRDAAVRWRDGRDGSQKVSDAIAVFIRDPIDDHNPGRTVRDVEYLQHIMRRTLRLFQTSKHFPTLSEILENH